MSQATQAAPPPAAPPATAPAATPAASAGHATVQHAPGAVPEGLRQRRIVALVVTLLVAGATLAQLLLGWQATQASASDTEQLIRSQTIKSELLHADALATNAFLVGGLEPAQQRAAYDKAIATVTQQLAAAASAQPADRQVLEALNKSVVDYSGAMALARANNRQGFPVGAAYLRQASNQLRATAIPLVDALVTSNTARAEGDMGRQFPLGILIPVLVGLGALYLINRWVAVRFKRRVNVGVAIAAALLAASGFAAAAAVQTQASENSNLRSGAFADAVNGAAARSAGNDAKAQESLRLIARGSGAANEEKWKTASALVVSSLSGHDPANVTQAWQTYVAAHGKVVALDDGGQWDQAVELATQAGDGGSSTAFLSFDDAVATAVDTSGSQTTSALRSGNVILLILAGAAGLAGLVAAGAAWQGLTKRLEEYA